MTTGRPMETFKARMLMDKIADGTWLCGDPGVQYEDTIQRWHTCPNTAPINSSNPCSEYMFIDDSACNLSSINLMKFRREDGSFDAERFRAAVTNLHHRTRDLSRPRQLPDRPDRRQQPQISAARSRLRQSGKPSHGLGASLRLGQRPGARVGHHCDHARAGVSDERRTCSARWSV